MQVHEVTREFARSTYAQVLADVPQTLFGYWAQNSQQKFPGIPRDASFFAQAAEGLMMFFDCAAATRQTCALPSRAADSVWHAWIRQDEGGLHRLCIRHFGKIIPHAETTPMALAVCLVQARRRASQPVGGPHLPRLFSLDAQLGMPHGFGYGLVGGMVGYTILDALGDAGSEIRFLHELSARGLLGAGLIGKNDYRRATGKEAPESVIVP